ncbi:hypothetical protein N657DRAFT_641986 [Parathielavia appendiculata]|uniref:Uncharacterized protein n=1 Tax=Parathielavia appendiculata TaxID=2587402 RepID=A0AAN6U854_9PEZI|nr:hypothetical protein N657DRAFT_641986 [Parathielavia appendiculata]
MIPDDCLEIDVRALAQHNDLRPCPDTKYRAASSEQRQTPPPVTVGHYLQRETLWFLTSEPCSIVPEQANSSAAVRPCIRQNRLSNLEARSRIRSLQARNRPYDRPQTPRSLGSLYASLRTGSKQLVSSFNISMIAYMSLYVDEDGLLDASLLPEPLKASYRNFQEGKKPTCQWMLELQEALSLVEKGSDSHGSF